MSIGSNDGEWGELAAGEVDVLIVIVSYLRLFWSSGSLTSWLSFTKREAHLYKYVSVDLNSSSSNKYM